MSEQGYDDMWGPFSNFSKVTVAQPNGCFLIAHTSQQLFPQPQPTTTFPKVIAQLNKKKAQLNQTHF